MKKLFKKTIATIGAIAMIASGTVVSAGAQTISVPLDDITVETSDIPARNNSYAGLKLASTNKDSHAMGYWSPDSVDTAGMPVAN